MVSVEFTLTLNTIIQQDLTLYCTLNTIIQQDFYYCPPLPPTLSFSSGSFGDHCIFSSGSFGDHCIIFSR